MARRSRKSDPEKPLDVRIKEVRKALRVIRENKKLADALILLEG